MNKTLLNFAILASTLSTAIAQGEPSQNFPIENNGIYDGYEFNFEGLQSQNCEAAWAHSANYSNPINPFTSKVENGYLEIKTDGKQQGWNNYNIRFTELNCVQTYIDLTQQSNRKILLKFSSDVSFPQLLIVVVDKNGKTNVNEPNILSVTAGDTEILIDLPAPGQVSWNPSLPIYDDGFDFANIAGLRFYIRNSYQDDGVNIPSVEATVRFDKIYVGSAATRVNYSNNQNIVHPGHFRFNFSGTAAENCLGSAIGVIDGGRPAWRGNGYSYSISNGELIINTAGNQEYYSGPEFHFFGNNCEDRRSINLSNVDNKAISLKVNMSAGAQLVIQMIDDQGNFASANPVVLNLVPGTNIIDKEFIPQMSVFQGGPLNASNIVGFMLIIRDPNNETPNQQPIVTARFDYIEVADITTGLDISKISKATIKPNPAKDYILVEPNSIIQIYSLNGFLVKNTKDDDGKVDLKGIQPGMYLVKIFNNREIILNKLIIE
jgi:hypothetical protein